ncbi:TPA: hypothetical protein N0F65_004208 [Lagenidium giganteum]|uniref:BTB domain-containing protein n=1 Tax=Lagenidium giganteum TaxID=4803 RepID=A0AAV2YKH4_9STRA|nr:TPA: hypothetical protein N0F65_004208 [Lagenidium giganteum]
MYMRWSPLEVSGAPPTIKNHTATLVAPHQLLVFGGYDGRRNHNDLYVLDCQAFAWKQLTRNVYGEPPAGRNGHTATLAEEKLFIIGGWLGSGPLAANDMHVLYLHASPQCLTWHQPPVRGTPPGPCNMHTADYIPHARSIFVFRGGDGREYLNDLHAVDIDTMAWRRVMTTGALPAPRANHSSAVVNGDQIFIFGGWDGQKRLNDIHILHTRTLAWTQVDVRSHHLPHPRAGMTFCSYRDRVFLFGGSGPSAKCYNDLHLYDPVDEVWVEVTSITGPPANASDHKLAKKENQNSGEQDGEYVGDYGEYDSADHGIVLSSQHLLAEYGMYFADGDGNANPNDNANEEQVIVLGEGPGRRAGHTCTVVDRRLIVFGGSYGSEYLNDFYVLDTDPPPRAAVSYASSSQILQRSLRQFVNAEEFSDVSFLVEGRVIYAHRIILSLLSERFRGMFTSGFLESQQKQIVVPDIRYAVFLKMMAYLYTGQAVEGLVAAAPSSSSSSLSSSSLSSASSTTSLSRIGPRKSCVSAPNGNELDVYAQHQSDKEHNLESSCASSSDMECQVLQGDIEMTIELLIVADQFMLDHLKQICERALQNVVSKDTVQFIMDAAERSNALQLKAICMHFLRNNYFLMSPTVVEADMELEDV